MEEKILNILTSMQDKMSSIEGKVNSIEDKVNSMEIKMNAMETKINSMDNRITSMESKVDVMDSKISSIDIEIRGINSRLDEHGQILKALEHSLTVNNAKQEAMEHDIAHIKGDVTSIKGNFSILEQVTAKNWQDIARLTAAR